MAARTPDGKPIDSVENKRRMLAGELYYAFVPDLIAERNRSTIACRKFNNAGDMPRRQQVEHIRDILGDETPLPPQAADQSADDALFEDDPWIERPVTMDYGTHVKLGKNVFINFGSVWLDTCTITVGDRTLVGPNCSFYAGTHPVDPRIRNGTRGPEGGKPITIGADCWIAGGVIILPGINIGRGSTVGAGSVVTKDVPEYTVVAGNPARVIRKIEAS